MADDNIAFVAFYEGWEQDGMGPDGLPLFRSVLKIRKSVPPYTEITRTAEPGEEAEFPLQYQLYLKETAARHPDVTGYPLAMWPVISPADFQSCAVRDIVTVEQLAQLANRRSNANEIPAPILELAKRAKQMIELHKDVGKFEPMIHELKAERDQLVAELKEANATVSAQNAMIAKLTLKAA